MQHHLLITFCIAPVFKVCLLVFRTFLTISTTILPYFQLNNSEINKQTNKHCVARGFFFSIGSRVFQCKFYHIFHSGNVGRCYYKHTTFWYGLLQKCQCLRSICFTSVLFCSFLFVCFVICFVFVFPSNKYMYTTTNLVRLWLSVTTLIHHV